MALYPTQRGHGGVDTSPAAVKKYVEVTKGLES